MKNLNSKAGVKTQEGKEIVRHNAFKHGLTSKSLLSGLQTIKESQEQYQAIFQGLRDSFRPRNFFEETQVDLMARAFFKMNRYEVLEASAFFEEFELLENRSELKAKDSRLELALKYKGSIESQFFRAFSALVQSRQPQQLDLFLPESGEKFQTDPSKEGSSE